jgi:hypothetical protein
LTSACWAPDETGESALAALAYWLYSSKRLVGGQLDFSELAVRESSNACLEVDLRNRAHLECQSD